MYWLMLSLFKDLYLDIVFCDESIPTVNTQINEYGSGESIRGEFYRNLKEDIKKGSVPPEVDPGTIAELLHRVSTLGYEHLEEWLCG